MPTPQPSYQDEQLLRRARAEFLEMPGMRLTCQQAQRLWGLDRVTCVRLLDALVACGFLIQGLDQRYGRLFESGLPANATQMAKAGIKPPKAARR